MPKGVYERRPRSPKTYPMEVVLRVANLYRNGMTQAEVARELGTTQKVVYRVMFNHGIARRRAAKRDQRGARNHAWKGDKAGYPAMHYRVYRERGRPFPCSVCGTMQARAYDWANLTGNYADTSDYVPMCRSCHWKHDGQVRNLRPKEVMPQCP
jgi:hypothetical protein